jgi:subtilase-type serine protease
MAHRQPVWVRTLMLGAALPALLGAERAAAQATGIDTNPSVFTRDDIDPLTPAPGGALDPVDITGIGQMTVDEGGGFVGLCTGTLINPRTVIFAGHCVNEAPANSYGSNSGGTPISFGFHADNLNAIRDWLGFGADPSLAGKTNIANALYNVEQVWYDPRSTALGPGLNFLQGDVALATLDTPARNIPTWTLLFSPLTGPAHATITGYGDYGNGGTGDVDGNLDFRRRAAENMVSVLGSLQDVDRILFAVEDGLPQSLYQLDFNDPKYGTPAASPYDFDIFGDAALKREGITAPGDSGGPLIIDQAFGKPVVAGVLSGGSTFYEDQPGATYGSTSFYQPLFLFWDEIVANNPYKYAINRAGVGDWSDPKHWVQAMDPNYAVIRDGKLVNALPNTPAQGVSGDTVKFGEVCDGVTCTSIASNPPPTRPSRDLPVIPGGPGSTNFVPDNVVADPVNGIMARYYDVTLAAPGITTLSKSVTIDRLTVNGATVLDVKKPGKLTVLGDFTQGVGWTNVDGTLNAGESLILTGLLTGSGVFNPTYLTSIRGTIAPGGIGSIGTLTVAGDVILSSGNTLAIELSRTAADKLAVVADADNKGILAAGGSVLFTPGPGAAPRYGQTFTIATAQGGVSGKFDSSATLLPGVLRADLRYSANAVNAFIDAGSLFDLLKGFGAASKEVLKFAAALDALRGNNYTKLSSIYGSVDLMSASSLASALHGLAPSGNNVTLAAQDYQRNAVVNVIADRLSDIGGVRNAPAGLALIGSADALSAIAGGRVSSGIAARQNFLSLANNEAPRQLAMLPEGMSGFISTSYALANGSPLDGGAFGSDQTMRIWHVAMGLEKQMAARTTLGFSAGFSSGVSGMQRSTSWMRNETRQMALYGAHRLGGGAYVAGMASAAYSSGDTRRAGFDALLDASLNMRNFTLVSETGMEFALGKSLTLTPRASLRYTDTHVGRYRETGGDAALQIDGQDYRSAETRIGAKLTGALRAFAGWTFEPHFQADWVRNLSGNEGSTTVRFADALDYAIDLPGATRDHSWTELRGGFRLANGRTSFGITTDSSVGRSEFHENRTLVTFAQAF